MKKDFLEEYHNCLDNKNILEDIEYIEDACTCYRIIYKTCGKLIKLETSYEGGYANAYIFTQNGWQLIYSIPPTLMISIEKRDNFYHIDDMGKMMSMIEKML